MTRATNLPSVAVLLSTYNGEKYVRSQIESILSQEEVSIHIYARDDESTDSTLKILESFPSELLTIYQGKNIGPKNSFFELLNSCSDDHDYFSFSDQDDVWLKSKCARAVGHIKNNTECSLYCSVLSIVDENLNSMGDVIFRRSGRIFPSIIFQNVASGNTSVFNKRALNVLREHPAPEEAIMHDWWAALLIYSCGGNIVYDTRPCIFYRQHSENVLGMSLKRRIDTKALRNRIDQSLSQLDALMRTNSSWADVNEYDKALAILDSRESLLKRLIVLLRGLIKGRTLYSSIGLSLAYLVFGGKNKGIQ
jgi:glycosyltransferase involved in cell wall biosynthesis